MSEIQESYSEAVLLTAWQHSKALLRSRLQGSIVLVASLLIGAAIQWRLNGLAADAKSIIGSILCSVGTAVALFAGRFLWHLVLAPFEILQAEIKPVLENANIYGIPRTPNYSIWKHRKSYNVAEFASLLVKLDPGSSQTVDFRSMQCLLLEDIRSGALKYSMPAGMSQTSYQNYIPDVSVLIAKEDALTWADSHGFGKMMTPLQ